MAKTATQTLYFEDFKTGQNYESGGVTVSQSQMLDFALAFDPQDYTLDAIAADRSDYGGLIASPFLILCLCNRLLAETGIVRGSHLGLSGIEDVHLLKPVRAEDRLNLRAEVIECSPAKARADRGFLRLRCTVQNQAREVVLTLTATHIIARKPG